MRIGGLWGPAAALLTGVTLVAALQPAHAGEAELKSFLSLAGRRSGSTPACGPASRPERLQIIESTPKPHVFKPVGNACLDEACAIPAADFTELLQNTFQTGLSCLASLSWTRMETEERKKWTSVFHALATAPTPPRFEAPTPSKATFAIRNALQLLLLQRSWPGVSKLWQPDAQTAVEMRSTPIPPHPVVWEPKSLGEFPENGPALFFCSAEPNVRVRAKNHGISMTRQSSFEDSGPGRQAYAAASAPGTPGWPLVRLDPVVGNPNRGTPDTKQALLFHEFFHLIGYAHEASVFTQLAGTHVPLPTACQICCFPEGFAKPGSPACGPQTREQLKSRACELCAGDHAVSHAEASDSGYRSRAQDFSEAVKSCYFNLNPL